MTMDSLQLFVVLLGLFTLLIEVNNVKKIVEKNRKDIQNITRELMNELSCN